MEILDPPTIEILKRARGVLREEFLRGLIAAGYGGTYTFECGGALAELVEARRRFGEMLKPLAFTG